jgi:hypothetical protein
VSSNRRWRRPPDCAAIPKLPDTSVPRPEISRAPFAAVPLAVWIAFGLGGILVNGHGQVLDTHELPIPGSALPATRRVAST